MRKAVVAIYPLSAVQKTRIYERQKKDTFCLNNAAHYTFIIKHMTEA